MKITKEKVLKNLEDIVRFGGLTMSSEFVESVRIAMEAYEQEPCEDCISRQAAIKAVWDGTNMDIYTSEVKEILEGLPSVQPEAKTAWIPVSERLPKDGESVLVSYAAHGYPNLYIELGVYTEGNFLRFISDNTVKVFVVKAWMPLPEPYEEDIVGNSAYEYLTMPNPYKKSEEM